MFVECTCPREIALQRLGERWKARIEGTRNSAAVSSSASDARPDLYDAQAARWEAFEPDEEPGSEYIVVTTSQSLATLVAQVLNALHLPNGAEFVPRHPTTESMAL